MEKLTEELLRAFIAFLTQPNVTSTDKVLVVITSLVAMPYLIYITRKVYTGLGSVTDIILGASKKKSENLEKNFPNNVLRNSLIQSALEKMVYEASADRAYVLQFHNGGENIKGIPFIKFSVTNEWCPISVKREAQNYKDVPLGIFSGLAYKIIKLKNLYFPDVEELKAHDSGSYAIFKSKGIESVYVSGLFDLQDSLVGLIILECFEKTKLDDDELFAFEKTVGIISGLVLCRDGDDPNACMV
jgi:hypothetical protein